MEFRAVLAVLIVLHALSLIDAAWLGGKPRQSYSGKETNPKEPPGKPQQSYSRQGKNPKQPSGKPQQSYSGKETNPKEPSGKPRQSYSGKETNPKEPSGNSRSSLSSEERKRLADPKNLALLKDAMQSSTTRVDADIVVDGEGKRFLCSQSNDNDRDPWWAVDLGHTYRVDNVVVYNHYHRPEKVPLMDGLRVVVSNERFRAGLTSQDLNDYRLCASIGKAKLRNILNCQPGAEGQYVYLHLPYKTEPSLSVCEVKVYGTDPSERGEDQCRSSPCQNQGRCTNGRSTAGYLCLCPQPYGGLDCEIDMINSEPRSARTSALELGVQNACFRDDIVLGELSFVSGSWMNVFVDWSFKCFDSMRIKSWKFYARRPGTFYAGIYKVSEDETLLTLVGKNKIKVNNAGYGEHQVAPRDRIYVKYGYVIGVHYGRASSRGGVLYYDDPSRGRVRNTDLSRVHAANLKDKSITENVPMQMLIEDGLLRLPALQPVMEAESES